MEASKCQMIDANLNKLEAQLTNFDILNYHWNMMLQQTNVNLRSTETTKSPVSVLDKLRALLHACPR